MKKLKELTTKQKIGIVVACIATIAIIVFFVTQLKDDEALELKKDEFVFEYGEEIKLEPSTFLKNDNPEVLKSIKLTVNPRKTTCQMVAPPCTPEGICTRNLVEQDAKKLECAGAYDVVLTHKKDKIVVPVLIEDTTAPEFTEFTDPIELAPSSESTNLDGYFQASDQSEVTITVDSSGVRFDTPGEYEIKVTASDLFNNSTTKKSTVIITSKKEDEKQEQDTTEMKETPKVETEDEK